MGELKGNQLIFASNFASFWPKHNSSSLRVENRYSVTPFSRLTQNVILHRIGSLSAFEIFPK